jgi:hypothetical protein
VKTRSGSDPEFLLTASAEVLDWARACEGRQYERRSGILGYLSGYRTPYGFTAGLRG